MSAPSGLFSYSNNGCECNVDLRHDNYGNPHYIFRVRGNDKKIPFRHQFSEGIKLVENHGDTTRDPVRDMPRTQECVDTFRKLGINNDIPLLNKDIITEKRLSENLEFYVKKYGFLFPVDRFEFEEFEVPKVGALFDRIAVLLELMNAVDGINVDYNRMFYLTFMLALKKLDYFTNIKEKKFYTDACLHPLYNTFEGINFNIIAKSEKLSAEKLNERRNDSPEFDERLHEAEINYGVAQHFFGDEETFPAGYNDFYIIRDYFLGDTDNFLMRVSDYENTWEEEEMRDRSPEENAVFFTEKKIKYMFVHGGYSSREEKLFYDFLFHFHFQVCNVKSININATVPITLEDGVNLNCNEKFNDKFKAVLRELAGLTIKNELDQMTSSVRTEYNPKTRFQGWFVPNLYTAIYYAISLTDREFYVYRTCASPYCQKIFPIPFTNDRRRYCTDECQWQSAQRLKRAKEKRKEAEEMVK